MKTKTRKETDGDCAADRLAGVMKMAETILYIGARTDAEMEILLTCFESRHDKMRRNWATYHYRGKR